MNRKFWIHLILVVFLGSCHMPSFVGDEKPDLASDASALSGEGSGQGGGGTITVTGRLEEREEHPPLLKVVAQMNVENHSIDNSCAEDGGGIAMPIQLEDADIELNYLDREVLEWEYSQPTVSGSSSWTLQLPCP